MINNNNNWGDGGAHQGDRGNGTEGGEEGKGEGEEERARGRRGKIVADGKGSKAL